MDVEDTVDDGTLTRKCTIRLRERGIKEILRGLGQKGFCSTGTGKLVRLDSGELMLGFCFNVGTYDTKVLALGVDFFVPLTEAEIKYEPAEPSPEEKETFDETSSDPVDPDLTEL